MGDLAGRGPLVWAGLLTALAGHLYVLYAPGSPEPSLIDIPGLDKAVHVLLFAVPALLLRLLTPRWWPIVVLALHAPISEFIQWRFVPLRSGDALDLVADLGGLAVGVLAARWRPVNPVRD